MRFVRRVSALAAIAILVSAAPPAPAAGDRPLRLGLVQQPNSLDPLRAVQFYENYLAEAIFSALTVIDDRGQVAPDLVERVPTRSNGGISADGKTITYKLRRGVRWQDGVPLTSHDVAFTLRLMRDPKTNFPELSIYSIIDRLDTPDDRTVVLHLRSPWADATSNLFVGGQDGSIVPEHVLEGVTDLNSSAFESKPIGSGPYRVVSWERGSRLNLSANPLYFRGKPQIERIEFHYVPDQNTLGIQVKTGELDFSPQIPVQFAARLVDTPALRVLSAPTFNDIELVFNTRRAPFDDVRVRRALALAVDRNRLITSVYRGFALPADDLVPPQSEFHASDPSLRLGGDAQGARRLLDEAGWKAGPDGVRSKNGTPLSFSLSLPTGYPTSNAVAVQLQAMWRAVGADASLRPSPSNVLLAPATGLVVRGDFELALLTDGYAISADRADTLTSSGFPPTGRNYARYGDPDVDRWTAQARAAVDTATRRALYAKISARVRRDAPVVPIIWQKQVYVYSGAIEGLRPEPVNSDLWNVYDWRLAPRN
jgi:peptide/nickel transport system substrate-binding protein